jgi:hypothetical protein
MVNLHSLNDSSNRRLLGVRRGRPSRGRVAEQMNERRFIDRSRCSSSRASDRKDSTPQPRPGTAALRDFGRAYDLSGSSSTFRAGLPPTIIVDGWRKAGLPEE